MVLFKSPTSLLFSVVLGNCLQSQFLPWTGLNHTFCFNFCQNRRFWNINSFSVNVNFYYFKKLSYVNLLFNYWVLQLLLDSSYSSFTSFSTENWCYVNFLLTLEWFEGTNRIHPRDTRDGANRIWNKASGGKSCKLKTLLKSQRSEVQRYIRKTTFKLGEP
jgi:hypothetical protein